MPARLPPAGPILVYVIGIAFFCAMDALMKALVLDYPASMATFWRYVAAIPFILPFWWREGRPRITRDMLPVNFARAVVGSVSAVTFFWSLSVIPLAEAVTIAFIAPLLIPPLAALVLKERMEAGNLAAGALGFAGVLVAVGFDASPWSPERLLGIGALMAATVPPAQWLPRAESWWLILAVGLCGAIALQCIARAYARAQAQLLAPFEYSALAWAALFGWAFFDEPASWRTWAGAAIIMAACLWQARRASPVAAPASPAA